MNQFQQWGKIGGGKGGAKTALRQAGKISVTFKGKIFSLPKKGDLILPNKYQRRGL